MTFTGFLFVYVLGGLTFIPLLITIVLVHAYLTFPTRIPGENPAAVEDDERSTLLKDHHDDEYSLKTGTDLLAEKFNRKHEGDVAAGYFAVCREYVPGGVNGKPPERTTPAGEVVAAESPSVYQSMYRSIFDRKEKPTIEPNKGNGKTTKKARNVFFVVLRHGHLMLYDDSEQIDVRYVISLEYHDVSIYGGAGGEDIPEGELWIKRNAICLRRKRPAAGDMGVTSLPFFLFSENLSEKEDFYFALLKNQQKLPDLSDQTPEPLPFNTKDIIQLVQTLHSSQEHLQTRWINALMGRLFLAMYKTPEMEAFIRKKIIKKISRVKKPNFITKIVLQKVDMGDSGPFILNPRLRDLTVDGDTTIEADIKYTGNFRIEIAATARIDLGSRFKAREVDIVLAVVARKLEGHALLRVKPPPSNRLWVTFETMPTVEMTIEPIVSTRQITYTVILRAIESRIREVIAETLVLPFWDDISFLDTEGQSFRGGIWKQEPAETKHEEIKSEDAEDEAETGTEGGGDASTLKTGDERTMSMPAIPTIPPSVQLRTNKSVKSIPAHDTVSASTTGIDKYGITPPPRAIRSNSFATPANPQVTSTHAESPRQDSVGFFKKDAATAIKQISDRSLSTSPSETPFGSPPVEKPDPPTKWRTDSTSSNISSENSYATHTGSLGLAMKNASQTSLSSSPTRSVSLGSGATTPPKRSTTLASFAGSLTSSEKRQSIASLSMATAAAAKKWGLGMVGRGDGRPEEGRPGTPEFPIGRGRPLPPPGQPLPPPDRGILRSMPSLPKRKPVPPRLPDRPTPQPQPQSQPQPPAHGSTPLQKPQLPERRKQRSVSHIEPNGSSDVLVVEAPLESPAATPVDESQEGFFGNLEEHVDSSTEQNKPQKPPLPARNAKTAAVEVHDGEPKNIEGETTPVASESHVETISEGEQDDAKA